MKISGSLCAILLSCAMILAGCSGRIPSEQEPNNTFSTATPFGSGASMKGSFGSTEDVDFFRYTCLEHGTIDVELTPLKGINHAIRVWKERSGGPVLLKQVDDSRKSSSERMTNLGVEPGIYFIEVCYGDRDERYADASLEYTLTVKPGKGEAGEIEPNDSFDTATPAEFGKEYYGYYSPAFNKLNDSKEHNLREFDYYKIEFEGGDKDAFLVDVHLSGVAGVNAVMELLDGKGKVMIHADENGPGEGEFIKGYGINQQGEYYLRIYSKGYESSPENPYLLQVIRSTHDESQEMEPNDTRERANPLTRGLINGKITSETDKDLFLYEAPANSRFFRLELVPPADSDLRLRVLDAQGNRLGDIDNERRGGKELFPNFPLSGNVYFEVTSMGGSFNLEKNYTLTVDVQPMERYAEIEPNDEKDRANGVRGGRIEGFISHKGDKDYFLMETRSRKAYRFLVSGIQGAVLDVSVTDNMGYIIKTETVSGRRVAEFSEMVDGKAWVVVESKTEQYEHPYSIEIQE